MDITNWNAMDWVAVIGAFAWAPQIISWIYQFFTKPKITLYLHNVAEIGYSSFGPIFNVNLALVSEKRGATLNNFSVNIRHENGAEYTFDWDGLSEDLSEIRDQSGLPTSIKKVYLPLVVRVIQSGVAQVFVRFQHQSFKSKFREAIKEEVEKYQTLKNAGKLSTEQNIEALTSEQEFSTIVKLINSEFIWVAGKYTIAFDFQSPNKFVYRRSKYTFNLTQDDIDELRKNIDNIKLDIIQNAKADALKDYKPKGIVWIWRNPELQKV